MKNKINNMTRAEAIRLLMPHGEQSLKIHLVLFVHSKDPDTAQAILHFQEMAWPRHLNSLHVLDVMTAPEVTDWFGLSTKPTLAVICDGALVALENDCSDQVCKRLQDEASTWRSNLMRS